MVGIPDGSGVSGWYSWPFERTVPMYLFTCLETIATSSATSAAPTSVAAGPDWWAALAGLHPLVLHFPIALVIVAAVIEFLALLGRRERLTSFSVTALLIGAPLTVLAAWSGWAMADEGYGSGWELSLHRWLGVSSAILLVILFVLTLVSCFSGKSWATATVRGLLLVAAILVGITAHFGGDMVWGESMVIKALFPEPVTQPEPAPEPAVTPTPAPDASSPAAPEPVTPPPADPKPADPKPADLKPADPKPADIAGGRLVSFTSEIQPILDEYCWKCHGPTGRAKAGIRLASSADFQRKIDGHSMVSAGMPEASLLYTVVTLPRTDEMAMPPQGPGLTESEQKLIRQWISEGASLDEPSTSTINQISSPVTPTPPVNTPATLSSDQGIALDPQQQATIKSASSSLKQRGVPVRPLAQGSELLVLNANGLSHRIDPPFGDADMALVKQLGPVLVELDLSNTEVTNSAMDSLAGFDQLKRITLKGTDVSDQSARVLSSLASLEVVNFFETQLGDPGLLVLSESTSLKRIYAGNSRVTAEGVRSAEILRPELSIIWQAPQVAVPDAQDATSNKPAF